MNTEQELKDFGDEKSIISNHMRLLGKKGAKAVRKKYKTQKEYSEEMRRRSLLKAKLNK